MLSKIYSALIVGIYFLMFGDKIVELWVDLAEGDGDKIAKQCARVG